MPIALHGLISVFTVISIAAIAAIYHKQQVKALGFMLKATDSLNKCYE